MVGILEVGVMTPFPAVLGMTLSSAVVEVIS